MRTIRAFTAIFVLLLAGAAVCQTEAASKDTTKPLGQQRSLIPSGSRIYIETMDNGFDKTLAAAFIKKHVPLVVVTDKATADYDLSGTTSETKHKTGAKIAAIALGGMLGAAATADQMKGSFQITEIKTSQVVYGYNVQKGDNPQSVAEACAKHIKNEAIAIAK